MPIVWVHPVNTVVARIVRTELQQTITRCSQSLESWLADPTGPALEESWQDLDQLRGAMSILELAGGRLLVEALQQHCRWLPEREGRQRKKLAASYGQGLMALPLYFDHALRAGQEMPLLLLPLVNELRAEGALAPLPEILLADPSLRERKGHRINLPTTASGDQSDWQSELPRLKHMFQTGLVGALRQRYQRLSLRLMWRSADRLAKLLQAHPAGQWWQTACVLLESWIGGSMENTASRRRLLTRLEQQLRRLSSNPETALNEGVDADWTLEVLFLAAISGSRSEQVKAFLADNGVEPEPEWTDRRLVQERYRMFGKTPETVQSIARELGVEMGQAKRLVEHLAIHEVSPDALKALGKRIKKIADAVFIVGLPESSDLLLGKLLLLKAWYLGESKANRTDIETLADALLFVESRFADIEGLAPLATVPDQPEQLFLISRRQLLDARSLVVQECLRELHNTQAIIGVYIENAFDESRLANLDAILAQVRGGLTMLDLARPANILSRAADFVSALHQERVPTAELPRLLEALADVLITLEHGLEEYEVTRQIDPEVLAVAERSLGILEAVPA